MRPPPAFFQAESKGRTKTSIRILKTAAVSLIRRPRVVDIHARACLLIISY